MQIQVLSNQVTTQTNKVGKPMQVLEVAYKNLTFQGKVESKKLFDFGVQADTFKELVLAKPSAVYEVEVVKNTAGFNDWVKVTKGNSTATTVETSSTKATAGSVTPARTGGWETPEERAKKQVYIIRQSSLGHAVTALTSPKAKDIPNAEAVIELAKQFEAFVFGDSGDTAKVVAKDRGLPEDMDEDIPF